MALTKPKLSTNINTDSSVFTDPILVLHQGSSVADVDVGFLMNRSNGLTSNAAVIWQESSKSFVHILTDSSGAPDANLNVQSYANVSVGNVLLINNAGIYVDGTLGTAGQVLASDGSKTYWAPPGGFTGGVVSGATVFQSNLVVSNTTTSTNTTTGALVVLGGAGISGNVYSNALYTATGVYWSGNGQAFTSTTLANTAEITANLSSGQNVGLSLTTTGVVAGNYGSATSIPTIVVDSKGRITSVTSNAVSTTITLAGGSGSGSVAGGGTLTVNGTTNQITTAVSGSTITIALAQDVTAPGNLTVAGNLTAGGNVVVTNGIFWAANGLSYSSASGNNPFDSDSNLGLVTGSITSSFDLGFTTDASVTEFYELGSLISNSVVYGTSIIANTISGSKLITGTDISAGTVTASNVTTAILASTGAANIAGNITSANLLPQSNVTYNLGSPSLRWKDLYLSGSSIHVGNIVITAGNSTAQINGVDIATIDNHDLDDISSYTNGIRQVFTLSYNLANVSLSSPWQLSVAVNGIPLPAFNSSPNAAIVWQSHVFPANKGYTLGSNSTIKFTEAPAARSDVYLRKQPGTTPSVIKVYPFKPIDIMIGY